MLRMSILDEQMIVICCYLWANFIEFFSFHAKGMIKKKKRHNCKAHISKLMIRQMGIKVWAKTQMVKC